MSVLSDLAGAFAERDVTVPVTCGAFSTRAFFDRAGTIRRIGGGPVQIETDTLHIIAGNLDPYLVQEGQILVGPIGADVADLSAGAVLYRVTRIQPQDDGMLQAIAIAGGAE